MYQANRQKLNLQSEPANLPKIFNKFRRLFVPGILLLSDYFAIILAVWTSCFLWIHLISETLPAQQIEYVYGIYAYAYIPMIVIFFINFDNMYAKHMPIWQQVKKFLKVSIYSGIFILSLLYFFEPSQHIPGTFTLIISIFIFFYLILMRYLAKKILIAANLWKVPIVLIGTGKTAEILMNSFEKENGMNYKIIGVIEDNVDKNSKFFQGIPIIGTLATAEEAIVRTGIKNVFLATPSLSRDGLIDVVYKLQPYVRNITFVPDIVGIPVGTMEMETLFDERMVLLKVKNNLSLLRNCIFKRIFDICLGMAICIVSLPLMGVVAVMITLESTGKVFYTARRLGKNGKEFSCYKFCTMYENNTEILRDYLKNNREAQLEWDEYAKLKDYDPRVTNVGKWLRKFSLDELPQIFNVIKGEMSLVGPRPYLPTETDKMDFYGKTISIVTPGITGLWQVSGRSDVNFEGRLKLDCWYIRNWSLWLDVTILLKTIKVVISGKGSY